jgi:hypothetical protein
MVRFVAAFRDALFLAVFLAVVDFDRRVLTRLVRGMKQTPKKG